MKLIVNLEDNTKIYVDINIKEQYTQPLLELKGVMVAINEHPDFITGSEYKTLSPIVFNKKYIKTIKSLESSRNIISKEELILDNCGKVIYKLNNRCTFDE